MVAQPANAALMDKLGRLALRRVAGPRRPSGGPAAPPRLAGWLESCPRISTKCLPAIATSSSGTRMNESAGVVFRPLEVLDDDKPVERLARDDYRSITKLVAALEYPGVS
jgi:hypothetical protein